MKSWQCCLIISLVVLTGSSVLWSQEPKVFNVKFTQRADSKVEVTYDLLGNSSKKYSVKLSLRTANSPGQLPISRQSLSGAIGKNVFPGRGLRIIWNLPKDYPQGLQGEDFVFTVQVFEQSSGGSKKPWLIAAPTTAVVGVIVYLILKKEKTGSIIIDVSGN